MQDYKEWLAEINRLFNKGRTTSNGCNFDIDWVAFFEQGHSAQVTFNKVIRLIDPHWVG